LPSTSVSEKSGAGFPTVAAVVLVAVVAAALDVVVALDAVAVVDVDPAAVVVVVDGDVCVLHATTKLQATIVQKRMAELKHKIQKARGRSPVARAALRGSCFAAWERVA
jgi:hypothetical protein